MTKLIRTLGQPGDLGWVVQAHAEIYAAEYGWGPAYEVLIAQIVSAYASDHDDAREAAWIAEVDGERAGSIFCVRGPDEATAQLRLLLVTPAARGLGLGAELVDTCLALPVPRATSGWCCGRTTRWSRRGTSTCPGASG